MSVVTGVLLATSCLEDEGCEASCPRFEKINNWLMEKGFSPLIEMQEISGGNKDPQAYWLGAGFNHFPENDFADFVMGIDWYAPGNVVLILQPEDGVTRVLRPNNFSANTIQ